MKSYPPFGDNCLPLLTPTLRQRHHPSSPKLFFMFLATCGTSLYFFPQTVLFSSFRQKLSSVFSIDQCVSLTITSSELLNLNVFHVEKLILGVKKAAHNKVAFIIHENELTFLSYIHVKTQVHRRNIATVFFSLKVHIYYLKSAKEQQQNTLNKWWGPCLIYCPPLPKWHNLKLGT